MPVEVYSSVKPPVPTRAWASAIGLLLGVTALAWSMASGHLDRHLGAIEFPPDWGISFRLPKGFTRLDIKAFPNGTIRRYESDPGTSPLIFSVWHFDSAENLTANRMCDAVLRASIDSPLHALIAAQAKARDAFVGEVPAKEVESPAQAMVVRAAVTDESAVAFALNGLEPVAVQRGYAAFDLACRSVEFSGD